MRRVLSTFFAIAAAATFSTQANAATLDGGTVQIEWLSGFGPTFSPQTFTVGAGVDYSIDLASDRFFDVDFSKDMIGIAFRGDNAIALGTIGYRVQFTGLDFGAGIASIAATFTEASGSFAKTEADVISFSNSSVDVHFRGNWEAGDRLDMTLVPPTAPVPLPAGLPLLLGGVAVFGLLRRRSLARAL